MTVWTPEWQVTVDGGTFTDITVANMSITSGRTDSWTQANAGYCSAEFLELDGLGLNLAINDQMTIQLKDSAGVFQPIFGGYVTDLVTEVKNAGSAAVVTSVKVTATGALSKLPIALYEDALSKDFDGNQIFTILQGLLVNSWNELPASETWAQYNPTTTWANAENVGLGTIDTGNYELQSRSASTTDMKSLIDSLANSGMGYIYEDASGRICYADSTHRTEYLSANGYTTLSGSQALWAGIREVTRKGDIRNSIYLTWRSGTKTAISAASVAEYGRSQWQISTTLHNEADAISQADRYLALRAYPRPKLDSITFPITNPEIDDADRDALIGIFMGQPLQITDLPFTISDGQFEGFIEGWTWNVGYNSVNLRINVSPTEFSTIALRWNEVSGSENWSTLSSTLTWEEATGAIA